MAYVDSNVSSDASSTVRSSHSDLRHIREICERFQSAWKQQPPRPAIEDYLTNGTLVDVAQLLPRLIEVEIELRCAAGEQPLLAKYLERFPQHHQCIVALFTDIGTQKEVRRTPLIDGMSSYDVTVDDLPERSELGVPPERIGRYRVKKRLGHGGFGIVYLAEDEKLGRLVAIKVPHRRLVVNEEDIEAYLSEARAVAKLDHPHIVPVYDVGHDNDCPCYVVSKFVDGSNLASKLKHSRLSIAESVDLVMTVAEALHYSHKQGLVHRDIKPGNILLDSTSKPYVADFGLALREQDLGKGARYAGTPPYMSPEQARGEGHRVDGRSDIFSLGIVLYELLTGRRPFRSDSETELLEQITNDEVRPPRQVDDSIPRELERICLKALSKRTTDRHTTAKDFADDLRAFRAEREISRQEAVAKEPAQSSAVQNPPSLENPSATTGIISQSAAMKVVPKGLRSFDARDAEFFLDLLPGPRDRLGLPDSIRFWKTLIEETDPEHTFMIGLIYGPSGCGKSSLVKAGLLPQLGSSVVAVYLEATAEETENRLLHGLRKRFPGLNEHWGLKETMAALRKGQCIPAGKKVLIVLDQFEQWLHAKKEQDNNELVQALRHCDGIRVQCLVMVRDDFWLAVSRFMRQLEIELIPGRNILLVDLFDLDHARKVLSAFGRAFNKLPENVAEMTREQSEFLKQAVVDLAQDNRVICVQLALFAEMMKNRPWTHASLKEVGGASGLGVTFLEETFSSSSANPRHHLHQKAARAVLKSLLPDSGRAIKGNMRSEAELLAASGYAQHPRSFDDLIRILDGELRLITPTDPEGSELDEVIESPKASSQKYYQLTHDFLVNSLRDWLTRKQRETRAGRAELRLSERAALWNEKKENRHLPSLEEYARIRLFTRSSDWAGAQRQMMRQADKFYLLRTGLVVAALILLGWGTWEYTATQTARLHHDNLLYADTKELPDILKNIEPHRSRLEPMLRTSLTAETDLKHKQNLALALVPSDPTLVPYLLERLLQAPPAEFMIIRQQLERYQKQITPGLWRELGQKNPNMEKRFRAACALALYDPLNQQWEQYSSFVADQLLAENPVYYSYWQNALMPVGSSLLPRLGQLLEEAPGGMAERRSVIEFFSNFSLNDPKTIDTLSQRLMLIRPDPNNTDPGKRKANIAAALLALNRPAPVWPLLAHSPDPTVRSFLIERLGTFHVDLNQVLDRFLSETDVSVRRALLLSLAQFPQAPFQVVNMKVPLLNFFENDPDPGVHAALAWLLRQWGQHEMIRDVETRYATGKPEGNRRWYVTKEGCTLSIIVAPPTTRESPMDKLVNDHVFAIGMTEVTVDQFKKYRPNHQYDTTVAATGGCPVNKVTWHDAAAYCNWLTKNDPDLGESECCYREENGKMQIRENYQKRKGYRLPTEKEWEFACRAGANTPWHFGTADEEITSKYAWWIGNSHKNGVRQAMPVGLLKPNDFGCFDMHGNVDEFCQETSKSTAEHFYRGGRGGAYFSAFRSITCDRQFIVSDENSQPNIGFRICRTELSYLRNKQQSK